MKCIFAKLLICVFRTFLIDMDMKFLLLMINAAAFCHGLGGNETEVPKATTIKPVVVKTTEMLSGID